MAAEVWGAGDAGSDAVRSGGDSGRDQTGAWSRMLAGAIGPITGIFRSLAMVAAARKK
jgi:hypothetical protein